MNNSWRSARKGYDEEMKTWLLMIGFAVAMWALSLGWIALDSRPTEALSAPGATILLPVPLWGQGDPRWGRDRLANTSGTLAQEGCAVASAAMVLGYYGTPTDPGKLNAELRQNGGFTSRGWLCWEGPAAASQGRLVHAYEGLPHPRLINANLERANPLILRLRYKSGITHFVVAVGRQDGQLLVADPAGKGRITPWSTFQTHPEALRFYLPAF